jgi:hypothetical protein
VNLQAHVGYQLHVSYASLFKDNGSCTDSVLCLTSSGVATDDIDKMDGMSMDYLVFCTDLLIGLRKITEILN